ncbi:hypothetical protein GEOBRER4_n2809 [Citrifermentans bremense]|uniref:Uncharacterized protein n=1 Tax=Citrifermentans bremense TaxID=60035 RepID=A0A7R7IZB9_9BACT|nr:hypothetical protein [Citrifermentans bremense]BCO11486.1 hypothetical protein GEOBRER4_n2809 [Citrifermentans bremense]
MKSKLQKLFREVIIGIIKNHLIPLCDPVHLAMLWHWLQAWFQTWM